jgi:hypothetical protein
MQFNPVKDSKAPRGQGQLYLSADVQAVLEGALHKSKVTDYTEAALKKCNVKGWIQYEGEDGETLGLTGTGKEICHRLGLK